MSLPSWAIATHNNLKGRRRRALRNIPPRRRNRPTNRNLARRIRKIQNNFELKHVTTVVPQTTVLAAGLIIELNNLQEGPAETQRNGDTVNFTSIQFRGMVTTNGNNILAGVARLIVFWDRQSNGALPSILGTQNSLLDDTGIPNASFNVFLPYNHNARRRFKVIYDRYYNISPNGVAYTGGDPSTTSIEKSLLVKSKRRLGRKTIYNDSAASIDSIVTNSLIAVVLSDKTDGNQAPNFECVFKCYFKDP